MRQLELGAPVPAAAECRGTFSLAISVPTSFPESRCSGRAPRHTTELSFMEQERQKPGNRTGVGWVRCLNSNGAWVQGEAEQRAQVRRKTHPCAPGGRVLANLLDTEWNGEEGRATHLRILAPMG